MLGCRDVMSRQEIGRSKVCFNKRLVVKDNRICKVGINVGINVGAVS